MRIGNFTRLPGLELAFGLFLAMLALQPAPVLAQAAGNATPGAAAAPSAPSDTGSKPPPGVPDDSSATTLELSPRPVAYVSANAEWANGFKSVMGEIAKVDAAVKKAGLTQAGHPFAVFLARFRCRPDTAGPDRRRSRWTCRCRGTHPRPSGTVEKRLAQQSLDRNARQTIASGG